MRGKRLFLLLKNLERGERLQLHHICLRSTDKRFRVLKEILDFKIDSEEIFESNLNKTASFFETYPDSEKALRRFFDFACKEIENLLLVNYLKNNTPENDFLLSRIFNDRNAQHLFSYYNEKAQESAEKNENLWMLSELSDQKIKWLSRGQMKDDMISLRILLSEKQQFDQLKYYQNLSQYYSTISALYLDDNSNVKVDELKNILNELKELTQKSPNLFLKVQFILASARFNFNNRQILDSLLKEAEKIISELIKKETQFERLKRSIYYLRILSGINYGENIQNLIDFSNEVMRINKKYSYKDSVSYFLNNMFLILNNNDELVIKQRQNLDEIYFDDSNRSYSYFLDALSHFLNKNYESALEILNNLSYAESDYVALWSKLMVIKIHSNLGNNRLIKNLILRVYKYIKEHQSRNFTQQVCIEILNSYKQKYEQNSMMLNNNLFHLFKLLMA